MRVLMMASLAMLGLLAGSAAQAEEKPITLKAGAGKDVVEGNCAACHSLDYIPMNSRFADAKLWDAEVTKMIKAMGAPIGDADKQVIVDYLVKNYGK